MNRKVLIVDDKTEFRNLTKTIVARDYDVETAENGLAALACSRRVTGPT